MCKFCWVLNLSEMHRVSIKAAHRANVRSTIYCGHSRPSLQLHMLGCNSYILVTSHPGLVGPWKGFWNIKRNCSIYLEKWHSGELEAVLPAFFFFPTVPFHVFGFHVCISYLLACCLNCWIVHSHSVWVFQYISRGCCQPMMLHPSMITVPLLHVSPSYSAIHPELIPMDFPWAAALPVLPQTQLHSSGPTFRHCPTGGSSLSPPAPMQAPFHGVSAGCPSSRPQPPLPCGLLCGCTGWSTPSCARGLWNVWVKHHNP